MKIVYYMNGKTRMFLKCSGSMDFSADVSEATEYTSDCAENLAEYLKNRTLTCRGCEVGTITVYRTYGTPKEV